MPNIYPSSAAESCYFLTTNIIGVRGERVNCAILVIDHCLAFAFRVLRYPERGSIVTAVRSVAGNARAF